MIREQDLLFRPRQPQRRHVKMVRMAVRNPDILTRLNQREFVHRQRPIEPPTAEITVPVSGIGGKHRTAIFVARDRRIAESFKAKSHVQNRD